MIRNVPLMTERVADGIRDGLIPLNNINISYRQKMSLDKMSLDICVQEIHILTNYRDDILQAYDMDTGLYFLYRKAKDDNLSREAYKAVIIDADNNRWIIMAAGTNPHIKDAYLNAYTDMERSIYAAISPEVFGALGGGHDDTDAFESMFDYMACMDTRVVILRSKYLITRDLRINIPLIFIGHDSVIEMYERFKEEKDNYDIIKNYKYGLILRNCNIIALHDITAIQIERIPVDNVGNPLVETDTYYRGFMEKSVGATIQIHNVLIVDEKYLDLGKNNPSDFIKASDRKSKFTFDKRYVNISNLISIGVKIQDISDSLKNIHTIQ